MYKYIFLLIGVFNLIFNSASYSQWQQVKSLTGGATSSMAKDGNTIYGVVNFFGLVKSTDNGNHWHFVNDSIPMSYYSSRAVSAVGSKILVKLELYGNSFNYSTDSGNTWQYLSVSGITWGSCFDVKLYKGKIIATQNENVFVSGDDGSSWLTDTLGSGNYYIEISDDRIFLVPSSLSFGGSLYTSNDSCNTWINLGPIPSSSYKSFSAKGDTLAVVTPNTLSISTNFGVIWNIIPCSPLDYDSYPVVFFDKDTLYFINSDTIFNSYDLGTTWNFLSHHQGLQATSIVKTGNNFLIGSWNHAFVRFKPSDNSTQKMARGIFATEVKDIKTKGDTIIVAGRILIYYSYNNGESWSYSRPNNNPGSAIDGVGIDTGAVYAASEGIFRSLDWGKTWSVYGSLSTYPETQILYNNGELYYATWYGIFKGDNQGGPITQYGNMFRHFTGLAVCKNKLFAVCWGDVYVTDLTPIPHWKFINSGLNQANEFFSLAANDSAVFITGYDKHVYRCYPPDTVWQNIGAYNRAFDLICYNKSVFTAKNGIEILQNYQGNSWIPFNDGLKGNKPLQMSLNDSFMFCGGNYWNSFGLFRRSVSDLPFPLGIDQAEYENDLYFSVYPNPVSDNLQINGYIQSSEAEINLIDITGRICFHKRIFSKGDFMININVNVFSEGIYILNLTDGSRKYSEKVLIKKS